MCEELSATLQENPCAERGDERWERSARTEGVRKSGQQGILGNQTESTFFLRMRTSDTSNAAATCADGLDLRLASNPCVGDALNVCVYVNDLCS